jgi:hypothetical protein
MKHLLIGGLIAPIILTLMVLSGCKEAMEETLHNEAIYIQCLDAKREASPLFAVEVYYQGSMLANLTNLPSSSSDPLPGDFNDLNLSVDGVKNRLVIKWLVSQPEKRVTLRSEYTIPFGKIDSVSSGISILEPEEKVILLYLNMDEQEFFDCGVYETIPWQ